VIFITNQKGISKGKTGVKDFKGKVEAIVKRLSLPIQVFVSTGLGEFRKPLPGMWDHLERQCNGGVPVDRATCVYVGDAAGREVNWSHGKKKDFSRSDRLFALNIGVEFHTPEEYFLNQRKAPFKMPEFDPRSLKIDCPLHEPAQSTLVSSSCELILTVGCPASGKSYFTKQNLVPEGYVHINRDALGSWQKCVSMCERSLQAGRKVVVDNTNPDKETRSRYISIAKKLKVPCRCFLFNISLDHAKHNNKFRDMTSTDHVHVNDIILNSFKNKYQEPKLEEGFDEILKINFVPKFPSEELKTLYTMFLLEK
jgi:bifunctional polynucleotide phosphatase/kinase